MKSSISIYTIILVISYSTLVSSQINSAKVYWVGHSLISHTDYYTPGTDNLIGQLGTMASSQSKSYDYYQHTIPGAPLGWNWGGTLDAWLAVETIIQPLINPAHSDYGTYDAIVITESVHLEPPYMWWASSFYARNFFNAAKAANPNARLFMYESWHHYQASDDDFRYLYGPMSLYDFAASITDIRDLWDTIVDRASIPQLTQTHPGYVYRGPGSDPGVSSDTLEIFTIPTGKVLVEVLSRLDQNLPTDDWTFNGSTLEDIDFFANPFSNFPIDTLTTVHPESVDDIHPSHVLIYLNALVHYAVVYQDNPMSIPPSNGVPANIANIFKEVVWEVVQNDPRTGLGATRWEGTLSTEWDEPNNWYRQFTPNQSSHVIVPDATPFTPHVITDIGIQKLSLDSGADIIIEIGAELEVKE